MENLRAITALLGWITALTAALILAGAVDKGTAPDKTLVSLLLIALVAATAAALATKTKGH